MTELTKEWLQQKIANMETARDEIPFGLGEDGTNTLAALRIALASLEAETVAYMYKDNLHADARLSLHTRFGNWSQEDINEYEITEIPLYTAPPAPASVHNYPETLPCPVMLEPGLRFGKAVKTHLVLEALKRRAEYYAELEAMTPEQRAEHETRIKECSAMLQGADGNSSVIADGWQLVPKEPTVAMNKAGLAAINEHDEINPMYRAMLEAAPQKELNK